MIYVVQKAKKWKKWNANVTQAINLKFKFCKVHMK